MDDILKFKSKLTDLLNKDVNLKINDNKSTFLSARKNFLGHIELSIHKAFLGAPDNIMDALKKYLLKNDRASLKELKNFMENYFGRVQTKTEKEYFSLGRFYDLNEIMEGLNKKYFNNILKPKDLFITWMRKQRYKRFTSITFGSYDNSLKLISINKLLDSSEIPFYFLEFVVYHEMLHYFYPVKVDFSGRRIVHGKDFKQNESKYEHFSKAKEFEKKFFRENLKKRDSLFYGRA